MQPMLQWQQQSQQPQQELELPKADSLELSSSVNRRRMQNNAFESAKRPRSADSRTRRKSMQLMQQQRMKQHLCNGGANSGNKTSEQKCHPQPQLRPHQKTSSPTWLQSTNQGSSQQEMEQPVEELMRQQQQRQRTLQRQTSSQLKQKQPMQEEESQHPNMQGSLSSPNSVGGLRQAESPRRPASLKPV